MNAGRLFSGVIGWLMVLVLGAAAVRAEDFSVHLDQVAEVDTARAAPEYKLDSLSARDDEEAEGTHDVYLRFKDFGDLFMAQEFKDGTGFNRDLNGADAVSVGWIKNSPDLLIVGWVEEYRGARISISQQTRVLQIRDGRSRVLLRLGDYSVREIDFERGEPREERRFSWDAKAGLLVERISSNRLAGRREAGPLVRPMTPGEEDSKGLWADSDETITITYKIVKGKLAANGAVVSYKAGDKVDLGEVADFYLAGKTRKGEPEEKPFKDHTAAVKALLDANPKIAERFKGEKAGEAMELKKGEEVAVPLAEERIMAAYAEYGTMEAGKKQRALKMVSEGN